MSDASITTFSSRSTGLYDDVVLLKYIVVNAIWNYSSVVSTIPPAHVYCKLMEIGSYRSSSVLLMTAFLFKIPELFTKKTINNPRRDINPTVPPAPWHNAVYHSCHQTAHTFTFIIREKSSREDLQANQPKLTKKQIKSSIRLVQTCRREGVRSKA